MKRALALIDGEHYAPVVRDTLAELPFDFVSAVLVGGTEKLRGGEDYGVPLADSVEEAIAELEPELVVDLSDEPVLGPRERLGLASRALAAGVPYAWRLENLFVVNAGTVSSLRLRGNTRPCYNVIEIEDRHVNVWRKYPFHGQERIIQFSTDTLAFEKYTARIEGEVTTRS